MGEFVSIRSDPPLQIYLSKPEGDGPFPCVFLFMHRPGLDESQKKVCDDLAKAGYVAIGTEAYRNGTLSADTYTDETIFSDFEVSLGYSTSISFVDQKRLGVIGFCMGGRHVYLAMARYSKLKSGVSYYGFPTRGTNVQDTPIDLVSEFNGPVLAIFGELDHLIPIENVDRFKQIFLSSSENHSILICEGVGHGFLNPFSKNHIQDIAATAWMKTLEHYRRFL